MSDLALTFVLAVVLAAGLSVILMELRRPSEKAEKTFFVELCESLEAYSVTHITLNQEGMRWVVTQVEPGHWRVVSPTPRDIVLAYDAAPGRSHQGR